MTPLCTVCPCVFARSGNALENTPGCIDSLCVSVQMVCLCSLGCVFELSLSLVVISCSVCMCVGGFASVFSQQGTSTSAEGSFADEVELICR